MVSRPTDYHTSLTHLHLCPRRASNGLAPHGLFFGIHEGTCPVVKLTARRTPQAIPALEQGRVNLKTPIQRNLTAFSESNAGSIVRYCFGSALL